MRNQQIDKINESFKAPIKILQLSAEFLEELVSGKFLTYPRFKKTASPEQIVEVGELMLTMLMETDKIVCKFSERMLPILKEIEL